MTLRSVLLFGVLITCLTISLSSSADKHTPITVAYYDTYQLRCYFDWAGDKLHDKNYLDMGWCVCAVKTNHLRQVVKDFHLRYQEEVAGYQQYLGVSPMEYNACYRRTYGKK